MTIQKMIASGDRNGYVKLWNLKTHDCIGIFKTCSRVILDLQVIRNNDRVCLVCRGDEDTMKVCDLKHNNVVTSHANDSFVRKMKAFRNGGKVCLASSNENGEIKIWME